MQLQWPARHSLDRTACGHAWARNLEICCVWGNLVRSFYEQTYLFRVISGWKQIEHLLRLLI